MIFDPPLTEALLVKRKKRFMADVILSPDPPDKITTIYCPNTGSMKNCQFASARVWCSRSDNPRRKYPLTWELVELKESELALKHEENENAIAENRYLAGINTQRANFLVKEALEKNIIEGFSSYTSILSEVSYDNKSRIDFMLKSNEMPDCYIEVKSVTLCTGKGRGYFPDAVTTRGTRHLESLIDLVREGYRAVLLFCVQHTGITHVMPASTIDPDYTDALLRAERAGVEIMAYRAEISPEKLELKTRIPVHLS